MPMSQFTGSCSHASLSYSRSQAPRVSKAWSCPQRLRTVAAVAKEPAQQTIRIKLKAYELPLLKRSVQEILTTANSNEANLSGPVPLPTRIRKYTVLRSPHVNKDSREQFETRTHQRLIDIRDPSPAMIDSLMDLDLPAGVDVQVKLQ
ncbi:TPA: ATP-citrate lyase beta-subunit [Trebouxia sp. C0005]